MISHKTFMLFLISIFMPQWVLAAVPIQTPLKNVLEVMESSRGNLAFAGNDTAVPNFEGEKPDSLCAYRVENLDFKFKRAQFDIGINPIIVESPAMTYLICMSVNLDFTKGSIDVAGFDRKSRALGPWHNITTVQGGIADKPSATIDPSGTLVVSYIYAKKPGPDSDFTSSLRIKRSSDSGKTWEDSRTPDLKIAFAKGLTGEQGNFTWWSASGFFVSFARYDTSSVFVIKSVDGGASFQVQAQGDHSIENDETLPPVTKTVLGEDGSVRGILLHYAHFFKPVVFFKFDGSQLSKPVQLLESATLAEARFKGSDLYLLSTTETSGSVASSINVFSSNLLAKKNYILFESIDFREDFHYLGAYQSLAFEGQKLVAHFIGYLKDEQKLFREEIESNP